MLRGRVGGGGGVCQGVQTWRLWSQMERKLHINCLELLAGSFAVKSFTKNRLCVHVRLRMDNTSAVAYVNRLGGGGSLPSSVQSGSGSVAMGAQSGFLSQCRKSIRPSGPWRSPRMRFNRIGPTGGTMLFLPFA